MSARPRVGDWGTMIYVQLLDDEENAQGGHDPLDISVADEIIATITKPDYRTSEGTINAVEVEVPLEPSDDPDRLPVDGWVQFQIPDENWLDRPGLYRLNARYTDNFVGSWGSSTATFRVAP